MKFNMYTSHMFLAIYIVLPTFRPVFALELINSVSFMFTAKVVKAISTFL